MTFINNCINKFKCNLIIYISILFDTAGMIGAMVYTYLAIRNIRKQINQKVV